MNRRARFIVICVVIGACRAQHGATGNSTGDSTGESTAGAESIVRKSLDSCNAIAFGPDSSAAARDSARREKRLAGAIRTLGDFSIFVPEGVAAPRTAGDAIDLAAWADCPQCRMSLAVQSDSGKPLETRIAEQVAAQRRIDSANADPASPAREFDEIDGPPTPFAGRAGRGYRIDNDCGDCASTTVLFEHAGRIATIDYSFDDNVGMPWRRMCEMTTIARSFAWKN